MEFNTHLTFIQKISYMAKTELVPAGRMSWESGFCCQRTQVQCHSKTGTSPAATWRSFLLNFLFLLDPLTPSFSSTAWRSSSYMSTGTVECFCLPSPQLPPVISPCLPPSLLPSARSCLLTWYSFSPLCVGVSKVS